MKNKRAQIQIGAFFLWLFAGCIILFFAYITSKAIKAALEYNLISDALIRTLLSFIPAFMMLGWLFSIILIKYSGAPQ